jgi:hypothetical protein
MAPDRERAIRAAWARHKHMFGKFGQELCVYLHDPEIFCIDGQDEVVRFRLERGVAWDGNPAIRYERIVCEDLVLDDSLYEARLKHWRRMGAGREDA